MPNIPPRLRTHFVHTDNNSTVKSCIGIYYYFIWCENVPSLCTVLRIWPVSLKVCEDFKRNSEPFFSTHSSECVVDTQVPRCHRPTVSFPWHEFRVTNLCCMSGSWNNLSWKWDCLQSLYMTEEKIKTRLFKGFA